MALDRSLLTSPDLPLDGPDAELIDACNRFASLEIERHEPSLTDEEDRAMIPQRGALLDEVLALRSTTPEGHVARARMLALYQSPDCHEAGGWPSWMLKAMLEDMLGLPRSDLATWV